MNVGRCTQALLLAVLSAPLQSQSSPALSRFAERKAEVLLREKLPCLGCHQFGNEGGRSAPDLLTVRTRRSPEYIAAIIKDPQRVRPGNAMPRHAQPAAQEQLLIQYLSTRPGSAAQVAESSSAAKEGEDRSAGALYARFCAACHGASGSGDGPNANNLPVPPAAHSSAAAMSQRSDDALYDTIAGGGAIMNRSARMPAFGQTLNDAELRSLVQYIRGLCKCSGPSWSTDQTRGGSGGSGGSGR